MPENIENNIKVQFTQGNRTICYRTYKCQTANKSEEKHWTEQETASFQKSQGHVCIHFILLTVFAMQIK